jgi:hypothetical protein
VPRWAPSAADAKRLAAGLEERGRRASVGGGVESGDRGRRNDKVECGRRGEVGSGGERGRRNDKIDCGKWDGIASGGDRSRRNDKVEREGKEEK